MQSNPLPKLAQITLFFLIPFLMGTAIDLYVPSLPFIVKHFQTQQHFVQFTVSLYMLGYSVGQLFLGIISDATGRKKILIAGTLLFLCASLLAVYAINIYALIGYRFLQGIGMAGMGVMCRTVAVDCYRDTNLVKKMSYYASSWALGPVIGPVIGGYLQHSFGWQANFYYFTIFSFIVLLCLFISFKETLIEKQTLKITAITSNIKLIMTHTGFLLSAFIATIIYSCLVIFNIIGPFIVQDTLHYSVISYGHMALILGAGCFIGIYLNRILVNTIKPMLIFKSGLIILLSVTTLSLIFSYLFPINIYSVIIPVFFILLFSGLILSNMVVKAMSFFPKLAGTTGAIYGTLSAGGIFVLTSLATLLSAKSQIPLLFFYLLLFIASFALFLIMQKKYISKK